jgi:DNA-binding CsgD family transcriptional regulator
MQPIYAEEGDTAASTLLTFLRAGTPSRTPAATGRPLTARELEVADLIAEGLTNGEIARNLGVSIRTVDSHVEHVRTKLGVRARSQIAVWARR